MKKIKISTKSVYFVLKKYFGIASLYNKYLIIGGGVAGQTLTKLLTSVK